MEARPRRSSLRSGRQTRTFKSTVAAPAKVISKQQLRSLIKSTRRRVSSIKVGRIKFKNSLNQDYVSQLIDQSQCECPICIDLAVAPVILDCGHIYCLQCYEQTSAYDLRCALCRVQHSCFQPQFYPLVQTLINQFILPRNKGSINYWCRQGDFKDWEKKRNVEFGELRMGDCVDVRDDDHIWRKGVIKNYCVNNLNENCINLKLGFQGVDVQMELPQNSRRLARYEFFTKTIYLKERTVDHTVHFVENIQIPEIEWGIELFLNEQSLRHHEEEGQMELIQTQQLPELALQLFQHEIMSQIIFQ